MLVRIQADYTTKFEIVSIITDRPDIINVDERKEKIEELLKDKNSSFNSILMHSYKTKNKELWQSKLIKDNKQNKNEKFYSVFNGNLQLNLKNNISLIISNDIEIDNISNFQADANQLYNKKSKIIEGLTKFSISYDNCIIVFNANLQMDSLNLI